MALLVIAWYSATAVHPDFRDVAYADASTKQKLDLYLSEAALKPQPLVILIHGGGFRAGDKARPRFLRRFLADGFAVASINYRLSREAHWPAQLEDVTEAIRFLYSNAQSFGVDRESFVVFGQSAGGHLAATATLDLAANQENLLRATVVWFGPVEFTAMDQDMEDSGQGS